METRLRRFMVVALSIVALGLTAAGRDASAQASRPPTLNGTWTASALLERWNVGAWGKACGAPPANVSTPGGMTTVRQDGVELLIAGPGRVYRTTECWESMPGLSRELHSSQGRLWQTRCASSPSDPRKTTVTTTIRATDDTITLDETGEFSIIMEGQTCAASLRRSRTYTLVQREGAPPRTTTSASPLVTAAPERVAPPLASVETTPPRRTAGRDCSEPGEPARIEVRPAYKLMRPGDHFLFRALVTDASGCPLDVRPTWTVASQGARLAVNGAGLVQVAEDATDATVELTASLATRSVHVRVEVATAARYESLLASSGGDGGALDDGAATGVVSGALEAHSVAENTARARKVLFVVILGSLGVALAVLGILVRRRPTTRARRGNGSAFPSPIPAPHGGPPPRPLVPYAPTAGSAASGAPAPILSATPSPLAPAAPMPSAPLAGTASPQPGPPMPSSVCPICGRTYDPSFSTCPADGGSLVRHAASPEQPGTSGAPGSPRGKICPTCGSRYGATAAFCGRDGTALVPIN